MLNLLKIVIAFLITQGSVAQAVNSLEPLVPPRTVESPYLFLEVGGVLEGSARRGGIQPDYQLNWDHEEFKNLRSYAAKLKDSDFHKWEKIEKLRAYINRYLFPKYEYDDPDYLKLLEKYRKLNQNIPLSAYVACGAGVCREHGIVMHFALREAGIEARYVYARVSYDMNSDRKVFLEDHAFNVIRYQDQLWVVDSYGELFHGFQLDELSSFRGAHLYSRPAPGVNLNPDERKILKLHLFKAYPKVICETVFK